MRPLRHNGQPYSGINVLSLWMSALSQNFAAPVWMTFRQASELNAHVRKGEKGSLVVYANSITRSEQNDKTGEDVLEMPYMKGYTVLNVEQIEGLPEIFYAKAAPTLDSVARIDHAEKFFASIGATIKQWRKPCLLRAGTRCRAWLRLPVRRPRIASGSTRGECRLCRQMARSPQERQPRHLYGSRPCPTCR